MPRRTSSPEPPVDSESAAEATPALGDEPPAAPPREPGFFGWLRRLDLPRRPGWLGGVCAGIADRLGVDPLLVRGVVVVIAVLGGPAALLYALAWFLLPDAGGTIHAEELRGGRVSRAVPGIVAVFLLSFVPLAQGFWFSGAFYWGEPGWAGVALRVLWTAALIVLAIVAVVWLARRASDITTVPATTDDKPDTVPTLPATASSTSAANLTTTTVPEPTEPTAPPVDASAEELAAWRAGQDEWQRQRAAWAADQRRTDQERRRAEARERAAAAQEAMREREARDRRERPRAGAGIVALVLGLALVVAAVAAVIAQRAEPTVGAEWLVGSAALVLVLGAGIVVVGLARRRSGALTFFGILAVLALVVSAAAPSDRQLLPPGTSYSLNRSVDGRYAQLVGTTTIWVFDRPEGASIPVIDLWQYAGTVEVGLRDGASVRVEVTTDAEFQSLLVTETFDDGSGRSANYVVSDGKLVATLGGGEVDLVLRLRVPQGVAVFASIDSPAGQPAPLSPEPDSIDAWDTQGIPVPTPSSPIIEGVTP